MIHIDFILQPSISTLFIKNASVKDLQNTPASALSGGQRSRVALAAVSYAQPHVLGKWLYLHVHAS